MPQPFDSTVVRAWAGFALEAVGEGRDEIDAINVFPVADGDTGTNLHRTLEAAARALEEEPAPAPGGSAHPASPALRALARGALLGACGNSGTILAQLLRGVAETYEAAGAEGGTASPAATAGSPEQPEPADPADGVPGGDGPGGEVPGGGRLLAEALRRAAASAYAAVARPVEGTMLTVASAASDAALRTVHDEPGAGAAAVARAAYERSLGALSETTGRLDVLRRAGVVDAGGGGLVAVLGALADALAEASGDPEARLPRPYIRLGTARGSGHADVRAGSGDAEEGGEDGGAYEVMYLLDAGDAAVTSLRERLGALGDSLVVGGGDGLWSVHVHVDDAGAAVEAGVEAGRPHRIRISRLAQGTESGPCGGLPEGAGAGAPVVTASGAGSEGAPKDTAPVPHGRAVVAVVGGDGLAGLCEEAGALVVRAEELTGADGGGGPLAAAVHATGAAEVVVLPNDVGLHAAASSAAAAARADGAGVRVAVVPTRAAVQGVAALAVHDPDRSFDDDVVAMTNAAGATRYGEVTVAESRFWTLAGVCESGDVLGLVDGDVVVMGADVGDAAADVLERMLAAGGELVTLVVGEGAPEGLAERLREQVCGRHLAVDTVVYEGRGHSSTLLIGVE